MRRALSSSVKIVTGFFLGSALLLSALFVSQYLQAVHKAKEAVLAEDLGVLRQAVKSFTEDRKRPPADVAELVQTGYLKAISINPIDNRRLTTW